MRPAVTRASDTWTLNEHDKHIRKADLKKAIGPTANLQNKKQC
jgi:hypothetical protein